MKGKGHFTWKKELSQENMRCLPPAPLQVRSPMSVPFTCGAVVVHACVIMMVCAPMRLMNSSWAIFQLPSEMRLLMSCRPPHRHLDTCSTHSSSFARNWEGCTCSMTPQSASEPSKQQQRNYWPHPYMLSNRVASLVAARH